MDARAMQDVTIRRIAQGVTTCAKTTFTQGATRCPLPAPLYSEVGQPHGALYHNVFLKLTGMPSIGLTTSASWAPNSS